MVDIIAKSPSEGLLPFAVGQAALTALSPAHITAILPFRGQEKPLSNALKTAHGLGFPPPGRAHGKDGARLVWDGQDEALLLGPEPDARLGAHAALVEQSDSWAVLRLEGADAGAVLARLCPLDLRPVTFKRGHAARSLLGHMALCLVKTGAARFDLLVPRSMGASAVADLQDAMRRVAARARLP